MLEVREIELEAAGVADAHERADLAREAGLAVRREAHHLELVSVLGKAEVLRDGEIQHAERMREIDASADADPRAVEDAPRRADEVAESVDRTDGGAVERADVRRARQMRRVMFDGHRPAADARRIEIERGGDRVGQRSDLQDVSGAIADRAARAMSEEIQRLPPQMRARIARDGEQIDVGRRHARHTQALGEREVRKAGAMLDAAESFLFDRGDELAVANERGRDIAVVRVEADDNHADAPIDVSVCNRRRRRAAKCARVNCSSNRRRPLAPRVDRAVRS